MLYVWGENSSLQAFTFDGQTGKTSLVAQGREGASAALACPNNTTMGGMPGGMTTLSASGDQNGVVWATAPIDGDANAGVVPGILRAYDAADFGPVPDGGKSPELMKLWEVKGFDYSKFCVPMVADGKLFVASYNGRVDVSTLGNPAN